MVMRVIGSGVGGVSVTANRVVGTERWRMESPPCGGFPSLAPQTLLRFRQFDFNLTSIGCSPLRFNIRNSSDKKTKTTISISTTKRGRRTGGNVKKNTGGNSIRRTVTTSEPTDDYTDCKPINVRSLSQNGDPLGRRDLGKCVVKWISQGMKAMATDFGAAELQGEFPEVRQRMGPGLTFVIQAQPYLSAIPMPSGLESVCLKACTHYPTLFDHFQRELRDVLRKLQEDSLVEDWQKTESWKLLKELAKSGAVTLYMLLNPTLKKNKP